jgi:HD-like signal output (HDOD) protein
VLGQVARRVMTGVTNDKVAIDHAMTAGILCDIGTLVLAAGMPDVMAIRKRITEKDGRADWDVENDLIGFTHMQVGAMLLSMWDLPDDIVEAVAYHHCPSQCPETSFTALTAVHVGNAILKGHAETIVPNLDWPHIERVGATDHLSAWHKLPESMHLTGNEPAHA